jgi:uncharacterized membrane protein YdbT with pleckstrin-like domain
LHFANKKIQALDVSQTVKNKILNETKMSINNESKVRKADPVTVSREERDQIIEQNVQKALSGIPENQRDAVKTTIHQKVEKQVDKEIAVRVKAVQQYSSNVSVYAKNKIATSFADLYKASIPFVLLCSLTGLIFMERRKKKVAAALKTPAVE